MDFLFIHLCLHQKIGISETVLDLCQCFELLRNLGSCHFWSSLPFLEVETEILLSFLNKFVVRYVVLISENLYKFYARMFHLTCFNNRWIYLNKYRNASLKWWNFDETVTFTFADWGKMGGKISDCCFFQLKS